MTKKKNKKNYATKLSIIFLVLSKINIIFPVILINKEIHSSQSIILQFNNKIDGRKYTLLKFLQRYGSPIAEKKYVDIIIDTSDKYNADYRLNVGIMTAESAICKKPLKKYNCFGYMNGRQYSNFDEALTDITAKVSKQYTSRYGWNITGMGKAYGAHNVKVWEKNVRGTAGKL